MKTNAPALVEEIHATKSLKDNLSELIDIVHSFSSVRRYSNKTVLKDENVAEHSSIVGIISLFLYDQLSDEDKSSIDIYKVLSFSIFHDFDEIFTGDMLNPVKYYDTAIKDKVNEYAGKCIKEFQLNSGLSSLSKFTDSSNLSKQEYMILKTSDLLSVFIKFRIENGLGNILLNVDYKNIAGALLSYPYNSIYPNSPRFLELIKIVTNNCIDLDNPTKSFSNYLNLGIK